MDRCHQPGFLCNMARPNGGQCQKVPPKIKGNQPGATRTKEAKHCINKNKTKQTIRARKHHGGAQARGKQYKNKCD
eukprot:1023258-Ditylum_brightwellii.AAC.1